MSDSLFDPDSYTSPQDSGREPRVPRAKRRYGVRKGEASDGSWAILSTASEVLPEAHRIDTQNDFGSAVTKCNATGRILDVPIAGTEMYLCPVCKEKE